MSDPCRRIGPVLGAMVVMISLAAAATAQTTAVEIERKASFPVAAGATVELRAVKGEASFLPAEGEEVVVEYARDVPADVKVVALTTGNGLTVCTLYASPDPTKPTECLPDGKGRLAPGKAKDQSRVLFRVRVPAGVHVTASIDHGDLKSMGITGNLHFYSSNGYLLVHDGGGPGTIHAGVGMIGNVDAVIAKAQRGPALRHVRLELTGTGRVRVAIPTGLSASYFVATQRPAAIDKAFGVTKAEPPVVNGHLGPAGESLIRLDVETGIAGQFMLVPAK